MQKGHSIGSEWKLIETLKTIVLVLQKASDPSSLTPDLDQILQQAQQEIQWLKRTYNEVTHSIVEYMSKIKETLHLIYQTKVEHEKGIIQMMEV